MSQDVSGARGRIPASLGPVAERSPPKAENLTLKEIAHVETEARSSAAAEIALVGGNYAVQGHSWSLILVEIEIVYDFLLVNFLANVRYMSSAVRLSSVCNIRAPYSGD